MNYCDILAQELIKALAGSIFEELDRLPLSSRLRPRRPKYTSLLSIRLLSLTAAPRTRTMEVTSPAPTPRRKLGRVHRRTRVRHLFGANGAHGDDGTSSVLDRRCDAPVLF